MGGGGDVGVDEAAGIRGDGHIQRQSNLRRQGRQLPDNVRDQFATGGGLRTDDVGLAEALKGGVVVDCQIHLIRVRLGIVGEQSHRGDVRRYHFFRHEVRPERCKG